MPTKINNRDARLWVTKRQPFQGSNLSGGTRTVNNNAESPEEVYTVYSYGYHFPLFVYTAGSWFENLDSYSRTTAKHRSQTRPTNVVTIKLDTEHLKYICTHGYTAFVRNRLAGAVV